MNMMHPRRKAARSPAEIATDFTARKTQLRSASARLLAEQIALEKTRAAEQAGQAVTPADIDKQAMLYLAGDTPEVSAADPLRLWNIRIARAAIERALELADQHEFLARVTTQTKLREAMADRRRASRRHRLMCLLALQAANKYDIEEVREIRGKSNIPVPGETPDSPQILLGSGAVLDGPTAAFIAAAIRDGVVTEAEIERARAKFLEDCRK